MWKKSIFDQTGCRSGLVRTERLEMFPAPTVPQPTNDCTVANNICVEVTMAVTYECIVMRIFSQCTHDTSDRTRIEFEISRGEGQAGSARHTETIRFGQLCPQSDGTVFLALATARPCQWSNQDADAIKQAVVPNYRRVAGAVARRHANRVVGLATGRRSTRMGGG